MSWLLAALTVLVLDQLSKALVRTRDPDGKRRRSRWTPRIEVVENSRPSGRLGGSRSALLLVWVAAIGGTVALMWLSPALGSTPARVGLGAAMGGATGNLVDILRRGAVVDFIDLRVWPVFNLADLAIVVGLALTVWTVW